MSMRKSPGDDASRPLLEVHRANSYMTSTSRPFTLLLLSLILHFLNYAILIPILNFYIFDIVAQENNLTISSKHPCSNHTASDAEIKVNREVSAIFESLPFIWFFPGLIPTLLLGPLVDRQGRKIGLLLPMSGLLIKQIIYLIVIWGKHPVRLMFIGNGIEGLTGGFAAILMSAFGMVADLTTPGPQRTLRISIIEACQAITASVAILAVGYAIVYIHYLHCVVIALVINIINIIFTTAVVPETLQVRVRTPFITAMKNIRNCFAFYYRNTGDGRRLTMLLGITAFLLTVAVNFSKPNVMPLFLAKRPLCWGEVKINLVTSLQIIVNWIVILLFMKLVQKLLQMEDKVIGIFGCVSSIVACLVMAFANIDALVYIVVVTSVFMRVTIPMIRSVMSRSVHQDEQGSLYAGMGCLEMVCAGVMGMLTTQLYKQTLTSYPAIVFLVMAAIMVLVLAIFIVLNVLGRTRSSSLPGYTRLDGRDGLGRDIN